MAARENVGDERNVERLTVRVPADIHEALRTVAFVTGTSINDVVLKAIGNYLSSQGHPEAVEAFLHKAQDQWRVALDKLASM